MSYLVSKMLNGRAFLVENDRMDRAELDALMLAARKSAFQGEQTETMAAIDSALSRESHPAIRCELLLTRAVASQINDDANPSADDALAAVETAQSGATWSLRAAASAIAAGFVLRTGDIERAIELVVDVMVLLAEHNDEKADIDVLRAANALSVLFSRLAAFELAVDAARNAWLTTTEGDESNVRSIVAYNLCSCGLARLRSDDCGQDEEAKLVAEISEAIEYLCNGASSEQARHVVGPGMRAELALLGHADPSAINDLDDHDLGAIDMPPQVLAWHQLVRSIVARRNGNLELAITLLDDALDVLRLPAAEEHNLLRAMWERAEVRKMMGDLEGSCADLTAMVERLHRAQLEQVGRLSVQISHRAESEIARVRVRKEVAAEMSIDEVTRVGTRRWLERCLEELANSKTSGAVIMLDLDHFKKINDTFGHAAGDRVLARVGAMLQECLRDEDIVARYGGEEFVVLLPNTSIEVARTLAERIGLELRELDWSDLTGDMIVTMSAGVSAGPFTDPWQLVEAADGCLYDAKDAGRDRVIAVSSSPSNPSTEPPA